MGKLENLKTIEYEYGCVLDYTINIPKELVYGALDKDSKQKAVRIYAHPKQLCSKKAQKEIRPAWLHIQPILLSETKMIALIGFQTLPDVINVEGYFLFETEDLCDTMNYFYLSDDKRFSETINNERQSCVRLEWLQWIKDDAIIYETLKKQENNEKKTTTEITSLKAFDFAGMKAVTISERKSEYDNRSIVDLSNDDTDFLF